MASPNRSADRPLASVALLEFLFVVFFLKMFLLCAALGTPLWMSEVSSHHSISAACEYSGNCQISILDFYYVFIYFFTVTSVFPFSVRVRVSTWNRLNLLRGGALSSAMRQALAFDPIHPVLAEPQLAALDRRLSGIIATVKQCMEAQGPDNALIEDRINLPHP